jgi:hypothetical protein
MFRHMVFSSQKERRATDKSTKKQNYQLYLRNKVPDEVEEKNMLPHGYFRSYFCGLISFELNSGKEPRAL